MKKVLILIASLSFLSACSIDASITVASTKTPVTPESPEPVVENRVDPDFLSAEIVQDQSGNYTVHGAFGEISEKVSATNGYSVEGVFYQ